MQMGRKKFLESRKFRHLNCSKVTYPNTITKLLKCTLKIGEVECVKYITIKLKK